MASRHRPVRHVPPRPSRPAPSVTSRPVRHVPPRPSRPAPSVTSLDYDAVRPMMDPRDRGVGVEPPERKTLRSRTPYPWDPDRWRGKGVLPAVERLMTEGARCGGRGRGQRRGFRGEAVSLALSGWAGSCNSRGRPRAGRRSDGVCARRGGARCPKARLRHPTRSRLWFNSPMPRAAMSTSVRVSKSACMQVTDRTEYLRSRR
jgi:hypothetical protein